MTRTLQQGLRAGAVLIALVLLAVFFDAAVARDYPVMFGTLYIFTLIGLLLNIVSDISYTLVDPRIDFEGR